MCLPRFVGSISVYTLPTLHFFRFFSSSFSFFQCACMSTFTNTEGSSLRFRFAVLPRSVLGTFQYTHIHPFFFFFPTCMSTLTNTEGVRRSAFVCAVPVPTKRGLVKIQAIHVMQSSLTSINISQKKQSLLACLCKNRVGFSSPSIIRTR